VNFTGYVGGGGDEEWGTRTNRTLAAGTVRVDGTLGAVQDDGARFESFQAHRPTGPAVGNPEPLKETVRVVEAFAFANTSVAIDPSEERATWA